MRVEPSFSKGIIPLTYVSRRNQCCFDEAPAKLATGKNKMADAPEKR